MKLNRRMFFQAAALRPAAVLQSGRATAAQSVVQPGPIEIDLAEPGFEQYIRRLGTDFVVRMEELYPAENPPELSGATLHLMTRD